MPKPTKILRERIQHKQKQRKDRASRLRFWVASAFLLAIVLLCPAVLVGGSVGASLMGNVNAVPTYADAAVRAQTELAPSDIRFFGRNQAGEPVDLLLAVSQSDQSGLWLEPGDFSEGTLNAVYAQWPSVFLVGATGTNPTGDEPSGLARWLFVPPTADGVQTPVRQVAEFVSATPLRNSGLGRLEADLLQQQIESAWRPEELAAWYLNRGNFGNQTMGLQSAARFYFGRDAVNLTLPEAAMLIGIPQNPVVNPIDNRSGAKIQQEAVLEAMLRSGLITQEQFVAARFTPLDISYSNFANRQDVVLERFLHGRLEQSFETSGTELNVFTTLDPILQNDVRCLSDFYLSYLNSGGLTGDGACPAAVGLAESSRFPTGSFNRADSVLAVVIDPQNGQILALSGAGEIATRPAGDPLKPGGLRESGGLFDPFVYLTALSRGHTLSSMVLDISVNEAGSPVGAGPIFLEEALTSQSPAAVEHVLGWIGIGSAFKTAAEMGAIPAGGDANLANVRFDFIELAIAFGVWANSGVRVGNQPFGQAQRSAVVGQVENGRGDILFESPAAVRRIILPDTLTWLVNQRLATESLPNGQTVARITTSGAQNRDEWTIGYTSDLVVAVWAGNLKQDEPRAAGGQPVTPVLWEQIMTLANDSRPLSSWTPPDNIIGLEVCWPSGQLPNGLCPVRQGLFVAGTEPVLFDSMYQSFLINSENGNLATSSTAQNLVTPITVQIFPPEAREWASLNGFELPPNTYDSIRVDDQAAGFSVESPVPFDGVSQQVALRLALQGDAEFDSFRIAAYQGLSPGALQILADEIAVSSAQNSLTIPLSLPFREDGLYTLLITGFRSDGSIEELSLPINASVVGPAFKLVRPLPNSTVAAGDVLLFAQVDVENEADVVRVDYYLNDDERPIVTGTVAPFTGGLPLSGLIEAGADCFSVRAVAVDQQGNESVDLAGNICFN